MPYSWEKTAGTLPQPELNPLTNPALERNLGRWAHVYFSTPPEQREQAISKLLQEIKDETSEILTAERARREFSKDVAEDENTGTGSREVQVVCSVCQHRNYLGNGFCGQCGAPISPVSSNARSVPASNVSPTRTVYSSQPYERSTENRSVGDHSHDVRSNDEVEWLRDRALGSIYESEDTPRRGWKYALGGLVILLAGFAYLQWAPGHSISATASSILAATPGSTSSASASPLSSEKSFATADRPAAPKLSDAKLSEVHTASSLSGMRDVPVQKTPEVVEPAVQKASLLPPVTRKPSEIEESGTANLRLAQRYLDGSLSPRNTSEAAKFLWQAVRKENTTAAVLLSDLYARGDGVPKSCDQARLLLVAAAKRGAPQAAEQLRSLEVRGCR